MPEKVHVRRAMQETWCGKLVFETASATTPSRAAVWQGDAFDCPDCRMSMELAAWALGAAQSAQAEASLRQKAASAPIPDPSLAATLGLPLPQGPATSSGQETPDL